MGPVDTIDQSQTSRAVQDRLRALPADQKEGLWLAFTEGLSHAELATRLDCPLGTIKSCVRRAMLSMRSQLQQLP